jgi:hypothetical protein
MASKTKILIAMLSPRLVRAVLFSGCFPFVLTGGPAAGAEISGEIGLEGRGFPQSPLYEVQSEQGLSVRFEQELYHDFAEGNQRVAFEGFVRWDAADDERTHLDIRELYWRGTFGYLDLYLGMRRVFWGVTESIHLVDIINQTDLVENIDTEDKLGQPMISLDYTADWGTTSLLYLPYFRTRTFPGSEGRLRPRLPVNSDNPLYESDAEEWHGDLAIRWSHILGDFDIALSQFEGTGREPGFAPVFEGGRISSLRPVYDQLSQSGLELQYIRGDWLWKLEAVSRERRSVRSTAFVGGFEYTLFGVFETSADLGIVAEYQFDDQSAPTPSDNDLAIGSRYTFNDIQDTDLLAVLVVDTDNGTIFGSIEGNRRIGTMWEITAEARLLVHTDQTDPLYQYRRDSYIQFEIVRFI